MYYIFCIHFSVERYLGSFQLLAIINKAAINMVEHVSLLGVRASFGYMPRSETAGSSGSNMSNFLRKHKTDFQSSCTRLQSHHQRRGVSLSLPASAISLLFDISHSAWCYVESWGCFDLHFPDD